MTQTEYYTAPSQEVFDEIKQAAIEIWEGYDDSYGYASEKINQIKNLQNASDNAWYMVAMFDRSNQTKLMRLVSAQTCDLIKYAMES